MNFDQLSRTYEQEFLNKVSKILKVESVYENSVDYPYGKPINDVLELMLSIGETDGFSVKNVDGHAGHIEFGEGEELLGILGHLDVVPAGEGWSTPPFTPTVQNHKLYARGSQDDKGPVMAAYIAMKLLKDQGFRPNKRVRLIVGTDEERDWKGIEYYSQREEMPEFGFSPDASFPVIHAEKGLLDSYITRSLVDMQQVDDDIELIEVKGGDRLNMVPDEAMATLRSSVDLTEHFNNYLREHNLKGHIEHNQNLTHIVVEGVPAHASKPAQGANAITSVLIYLESLSINSSHKELIKQINYACSSSDGSGMGVSQKDDISGALTLNLGSLTYRIGERVTIGLNIRYPVTASYETLLATLSEFAEDIDGNFEVYDHLKPLHVEADHPFIQTLLRVCNDVTGEEENVKTIGGATYARSLKTGVAFGALFNDSPDTAHQKDEHVRIEDMIRAIRIYATSIYELTK